MIFERILIKSDERLWTGFIWLGLGISDELF
jgi:hypothetical protein